MCFLRCKFSIHVCSVWALRQDSKQHTAQSFFLNNEIATGKNAFVFQWVQLMPTQSWLRTDQQDSSSLRLCCSQSCWISVSPALCRSAHFSMWSSSPGTVRSTDTGNVPHCKTPLLSRTQSTANGWSPGVSHTEGKGKDFYIGCWGIDLTAGWLKCINSLMVWI